MENKVTLYIATHNTTGLKYFGKTKLYHTENELQEKYHGSGKNWTKHLKEFGDDVTMEIYGIYSLDEVENKARSFSLVNDIVGSNNWANMILEDGLDAGGTTGYKHTKETKEKQRTYARNNIHSEETKSKIGKAVSKKLKGKAFSEEHKRNMRVKSGTQKNPFKGYDKVICPYCEKEGKGGGMTRYHFDNCKLKKD